MKIVDFIDKNKFYLYVETINKVDDFNYLIKSIPFISEIEKENIIKFSNIDNYKNSYIKVVIEDLKNIRLKIGFYEYKGDLTKIFNFNNNYEIKFNNENGFYKCKIKVFYDNKDSLDFEIIITIKLIKDKLNFSYLRRIFYNFFNKYSKNIKRGYYYNNITFNLGNNNNLSFNHGFEFGYLIRKKKFKINYKYFIINKIFNKTIIEILNKPRNIELSNTIYTNNFNNLLKLIKKDISSGLFIYDMNFAKIIRLIKNIIKIKIITIII